MLLASGSSVRADIEALLAAYDVEIEQFSEGMKGVAKEDRQKYYDENYPKPGKTGEALKKLVGENPAASGVPGAYGWMLARMRADVPEGIVDVLKEHHLENPALAEFVMMGAYTRDASMVAFIEELAESSVVAQTKAAAAYTVASKLSRSNTLEDQEKRERLLEASRTGIGDLEVRGRKIADLIDGALFEARNLGLGKEAPEIEGEDVDGVAFKLSDYRGKVVVIDFWGDW